MHLHTPKLSNVIYLLFVIGLMVFVSLSWTYKQTKKIFADSDTQTSYGVGMDYSSKGFIIHVIIFSILIFMPLFYI